jgi:site-specific DNA recombinase
MALQVRKSRLAPKPRRVVLYCRVSTDEQAQGRSVSLQAQEEALRAFARHKAQYFTAAGEVELARSWAKPEVLREVASGREVKKRPEMTALLKDVQAGTVAGLCVLRVDRAARNTKELLEIVEACAKADCAFLAAHQNLDTGTSTGKLMLTMLAAIATLESDQTSEKVKLSLAKKRREGQVYSKVAPFGWVAVEGRLVEVPEEQEALRAAQRMRDKGKTFRAIAAWLTGQGIKPHGGGSWWAASVRSALSSKMAARMDEVA